MADLHGNLQHILTPTIRPIIAAWLAEDCPAFDVGGFVVGDKVTEACLLAKSPGKIAGRPFFDEVFRQLDCSVVWHQKEGWGIPVTGRHHIATITGPARQILLGERVALNILARCSGIATRCAHFRNLLNQAGYTNVLSGTRKTTPGFRLVEKYGMLIGGCDTHRMDLSSMIMLKDNHVVASGSITRAIAAAKASGGFSLKIEVECKSRSEAEEAIRGGADIVMLDNFSANAARLVATQLKGQFGASHKFLIEVSGGLDEANIEQFAASEIDIISTSSIHQGVPHVDFSLKLMQEESC